MTSIPVALDSEREPMIGTSEYLATSYLSCSFIPNTTNAEPNNSNPISKQTFSYLSLRSFAGLP